MSDRACGQALLDPACGGRPCVVMRTYLNDIIFPLSKSTRGRPLIGSMAKG